MRVAWFDPEGPGPIVPVRGVSADAAWGGVCTLNPLDEAFDPAALQRAGERVVMWSGTPADDLFARDVRTWSGGSVELFDDVCARLRPLASRNGQRVLVRPHARHVLSDGPSALSWLERWKDGPFGLALDPCALLERGFGRDGPDLLRRFAELAGPAAGAWVLSGVREPAGGAGESAALERVPPSRGEVDPRVLGGLVREHAAEGSWVVVAGGDASAEVAALGLDG